jgi:hypothetical protein
MVVEQPQEEAIFAKKVIPKSSTSLYGFAIFGGAFLLFQVQLILGKYALPWFGGAPAVWTTCMLFFQLLLLGGYFYSHAVSRLSLRRQSMVHVALLGLSVGILAVGTFFWKTPLLPGPSWRPGPLDSPVVGILGLLSVAVGIPYLCLSTTGPLLQNWFARAHAAESPYRLYALSNAGSLLGLVTYPFIFEPNLRLHTQAWLWAAGYVAFSAACIVCARKISTATDHAPAIDVQADVTPPGRWAQALWFLLPACASVMLLATTNLLCQEVAVVPFLWVLPLSLYLLSFIVCFDNPKWYRRELFQILMAVGLPIAFLALLSGASAPMGRQIFRLSLVLFACCMVCHGELVRLRPQPALLTRFYLLVSAGGAAGGIFVVAIAPLIFTGFWEFHFGLIGCVAVAILALIVDRGSWWHQAQPYVGMTILLALALVPEIISRYVGLAVIPEMMDRVHYYPILTVLALTTAVVIFAGHKKAPEPARFNTAQFASVAVLAALCAALYQGVQFDKNRQVRRDRNFYSALQIQKGAELNSLELRHGQTSHGIQSRLHPKEPTLYYARLSGIGLLLGGANACLEPCSRRIAVVGLGAGTLAAYGRPGDTMRFYELNPQVIAYSDGTDPYFTFLRDSSAKIETVLGDARISLEHEFKEKGSLNFDVIVIDAFSSDAIPAHLLTSEALDVYLEHLRGPNSILAFHISNRVLDLRYVLAALAAQKGLAIVRLHKNRSNGGDTGERSDWVMLARNPQALQLSVFQGHVAPMPGPDNRMLWTDNYSNLYRVLLRR